MSKSIEQQFRFEFESPKSNCIITARNYNSHKIHFCIAGEHSSGSMTLENMEKVAQHILESVKLIRSDKDFNDIK